MTSSAQALHEANSSLAVSVWTRHDAQADFSTGMCMNSISEERMSKILNAAKCVADQSCEADEVLHLTRGRVCR